ncbi:MAG: hypothetical protein WBD78_04755, partial [Methylocella sp.]
RNGRTSNQETAPSGPARGVHFNAGGASILFVVLVAAHGVWYWSAGFVSVDTIASPKVEMFYWGAILFSQTLGTALGDWMADTTGLGYEGGALVFAAGLVLVAGGYFYTNVSRTLVFWSAFILTRPLGATVGDLLDKPLANGGSRLAASMPRQFSRPSSSPASCSSRKKPASIRERMSRTHE